MKVIDCWDILVWDGGDRHNHRYFVATKELATEWVAKHKNDLIIEKQFIILESYQELMDHEHGDARRRALAKLTEQDKIALGLK